MLWPGSSKKKKNNNNGTDKHNNDIKTKTKPKNINIVNVNIDQNITLSGDLRFLVSSSITPNRNLKPEVICHHTR